LIVGAYHRVRTVAQERNLPNRSAALILGIEKVAREKQLRGLYP
jgi:glutamate dehydrogenase (NAD(P)+)